MPLANYAVACAGLAQELAMSLASDDANALAQDLSTLGNAAWCQWCVDHETEITDYIEATPAKRSARKLWQAPQLRRRLVLASWQRCQESEALLRLLVKHAAVLQPGGPYRTTAAWAALAYWEITEEIPPIWPSEWAAPCPFLARS